MKFDKNKKVSSRRGDVQQKKKNPIKVIFSARRPFFASLIRLYSVMLEIEWLGKKTRLLCEPELIEQDMIPTTTFI